MKQQASIFSILLLGSLVVKNQSSNAMEKKNLEKTPVLMYSLETTLATMMNDFGEVPNDIVVKAQELGLEITGPQIWQYEGADGRPETVFKLDICLPVNQASGNAGKFRFGVLPEGACISDIHKGSWAKLGDTYCRMFGEISRKGIVPTGLCREIYHHFDMENEEVNVTEVQVMIQ